MSENIIMYGYHGTFADDILDIQTNGFTYEHRDDHWLGQGIYFYDTFKLAEWFVSKKKRTKGIDSKIAVVKVLLSTSIEKILNLDTIDGVDLFYSKVHEMWNEFRTIEFSPDNDHKNRCFLLDVIKEVLELDIIIYTFIKADNPSYGEANTNWFERNLFPLSVYYKETQICATNNKCVKILNVEYPEKEFEYPTKIRFKKR